MLKTFTCENCRFSLNITKVKPSAADANVVEKKAPGAFVKHVKEGTLVDADTRFVFSDKELEAFMRTKTDKEAVIKRYLDAYKSYKSQLAGNVILECKVCDTHYVLPPGTTIYHMSLGATERPIKPIDIEVALMDPTLPRTKDYVCRKADCITHKDLAAKEAVIWKIVDSTGAITRYICAACNTAWTV